MIWELKLVQFFKALKIKFEIFIRTKKLYYPKK